jgi:5'(3')-deoxyribonucleotidase
MNKYRIFIDMDGVIADFEKASNEFQRIHGKTNRPDKWVDYRNLDVIEGAIEAVAKLNADHEVFIASTPPWTRPEVWGHKREWIGEHFPYLKRKIILTHRKDLLIGDILIDDSRYRGQPDFQGEWYWFNKNWNNRNWEACLEWIYKEYKK